MRSPRRPPTRWILLAVAAAAVVTLVGVLVSKREAPSEPTAVPPTGERPGARPRLKTVLVRTGRRPPVAPRPGAGPPKAATGVPGAEAPQYVPGQLLVKFEDDVTARAAAEVVEEAGGDVEERIGKLDVRVVEVPRAETREAIAELEASPGVEYVERDVAVQKFDTVPNDSLWSTQWGPALVEAPKAWDSARGSPQVVIAVLDTGTAPNHPDLSGRLVAGFDFVNGDADPSDDEGHGTASAGVIGASTDNGEGQAGLCWTCSLMPIKVLDAEGGGDSSSVAAGVLWAVDHGARVISMSLGGEGTTQTLTDAIQYAAGKGVLLVAAAGNEGTSTQTYPAAYPQVLSVAGTTESDSLYSWSNFGPWVQLAAPGCNTAPYLDGRYVNFCGTSSATPLVAGLVGLALSARPGASKAEVEQALRSTAAPLPGVVQYGRVNASAALAALGVRPVAPTPTPSAAPGPANQLRGSLSRRVPLRRHVRLLDQGAFAAELTFRGASSLTLALIDAEDAIVARAAGASPLRLNASVVEEGAYEVVVSGRKLKRAVRYSLRASGESE
jgi:subtilisin family serine protease